MPMGVEDRVVFSVLYNESAEFLASLIASFLAHTGPESLLVLNLPPGRPLPPVLPAGKGRVFVMNAVVAREKVGHTLLVGHLEAFGFALRQIGGFGHFCALASNSLLFRRFDRAATLAHLAAVTHAPQIEIAAAPDNWWWSIIGRNPRFLRELREAWGITHSLGGQIEGLFATREDWALVHARLPEVMRLGALMEPEHRFPLEEVLPVAVFLNHGSARYLNLCHVHWTRAKGGLAELGDLLDAPRDLPAHVCAMKWFERSADAPVTAAVTEGWSQGLLEAWVTGDANQRLGQRLLLEQAVAALRAREEFQPFGAAWGAPQPFGLPPQVLEAAGGRILVPTGQPAADAAEVAFIFLERTGHRIRLGLEITEAAATRLRLDCHAEQPGGTPVVEGYLYLNALQAAAHWTCRLRLPLPIGDAAAAAMERLVLLRGGRFQDVRPQHVVDAGGYRELHFRWGDAGTDGTVWLGIPFLTDFALDAWLDRVG